MRWRVWIRRIGNILIAAIFLVLFLTTSSMTPADQTERIRAFTRDIEFDYVGWTLGALQVKLNEFALGTDTFLSNSTRHKTVIDYLDLVTRLQQGENRLVAIYADPNIKNKQMASAVLRRQIEDLRSRRDELAPVAEATLQSQISSQIARLGLGLGGQPVPPVLFHSTPLPLALIVSPRSVIRQDEDISLVPDLGVDKHSALEDQVDQALNVSSLVVNIGGVGVYPTMVYQTNDLNWLSDTISHEWIHNFLELRPLGLSYFNSPELRTMNETTASIAGNEIGLMMLKEYYPELVPQPAAANAQASNAATSVQAAPAFDFNKEMHCTRVNVDRLLAAGKITEAEQYMDQRRVVFWDHGYLIRKLNQAYFAFHGAYADNPSGGASGEDPVGAAVRKLRARSASLTDFLNRISWMSTFDQLKRAVQ